MSDMQGVLANRVSALELVEAQFRVRLLAGRLSEWSSEELKEAVEIGQQHKRLAIQAIQRHELDQAIHNLETAIYLMSGFVEDDWDQDDICLN